jgi:SOS response regulatory protein OraA/RecX
MIDRDTARTLARELRRADALGVAVRTLRHRDLSRTRLEERLAQRGADGDARAAAIETLERAGLVDDGRVAAGRAAGLAGRGFGDAAIRAVLEHEGLAAEDVEAAIAELTPEADRAREWLARRGPGPKTLRWLAAKGFDRATLEDLGGFADGA